MPSLPPPKDPEEPVTQEKLAEQRQIREILLARFYELQFLKAVELESEGEYDEAISICFTLRIRSDLDVFRRAALNAFMAIIINPRTHDPKDFARECLDFCQLFRDSNREADETKKAAIGGFERSSRYVLQQKREELLAEWAVVGGKRRDDTNEGDECDGRGEGEGGDQDAEDVEGEMDGEDGDDYQKGDDGEHDDAFMEYSSAGG